MARIARLATRLAARLLRGLAAAPRPDPRFGLGACGAAFLDRITPRR